MNANSLIHFGEKKTIQSFTPKPLHVLQYN